MATARSGPPKLSISGAVIADVRFSQFVAGIRDLLTPTEIWNDLCHATCGVRDLVESLWNEEASSDEMHRTCPTGCRPLTNSVLGIDFVVRRRSSSTSSVTSPRPTGSNRMKEDDKTQFRPGKSFAGELKGVYGDAHAYVEKERESWDSADDSTSPKDEADIAHRNRELGVDRGKMQIADDFDASNQEITNLFEDS